MKKYIVTVYNSKENALTTIELLLNSLGEVDDKVSEVFNGWGIITAVIVASQYNKIS